MRSTTLPISHERTDLLTEVLNAVIETQDSYAKDWTRALHGKLWESERKATAQ